MCQGLTEELDARANGLPVQGAGNSGSGGRRADRARRASWADLDAQVNRLSTTGSERAWWAPQAEPRPIEGNGDGSAGTDRALRQLFARVEELEELLADAQRRTQIG